MPARKINPVPEMISGVKWEVRESLKEDQAYVDLYKKQMVVPLDDSDKSEMLRAHEMMHVSISPIDGFIRIPKEIGNRTLQAVEDCRIWQEIKRVGIKCDQVDVAVNERGLGPILRPYMLAQGATEEQIELEATQYLLSKVNTGSEQWIREELAANGFENSLKAADEVISNFYNPHKGRQMPFESVIEAANYLHEYFQAKSAEPPPPEDDGEEGEGNGDGMLGEGESGENDKDEKKEEEGEGNSEEEEEKEEKNAKLDISPVTRPDQEMKTLPEVTIKERQEFDEADIEDTYLREGGAKTGELVVWYPPLKKRFTPKKGRKKINTDAGVNPRNLYRATLDQKVFSEKAVRDYGVVIIIDCSGSMQVSEYDVNEVLEHCPAATIGLYASNNTNQGGYLKVVVDRKMKLDTSVVYYPPDHHRGTRLRRETGMLGGLGGGNVVDLPAVEWLSKRREETKIWVCDGIVTGKLDSPLDFTQARRITRLVLDNNIKRYKSVQELLFDKNSWWRKGSR